MCGAKPTSAPGILLLIFLVLAVSTPIANAQSKSSAMKRCNVMLIVSDALRYDVLGCYGGKVPTPNIDWLAANGVVFENGYSTAPSTIPSSVSMLTGDYATCYGVVREKMKMSDGRALHFFYVNNSNKLLAERLNEAGYDVRMDVENILAVRSNNGRGFKEFRAYSELSEKEIRYVEESVDIRHIGRNERKNLSSRYDRMYALLHYLLTVPSGRNFFVLKWFMDPHAPYHPPAEYMNKIGFDTSKLPKDPKFYSENNIIEMKMKRDRFAEAEYAYMKELYEAEVRSVDERVGYIIKALKRNELLKNTLIVFTSDHGELFGEHNHLGHGSLYYDLLVKVPLIFVGPGIPQGKRIKSVVSHLDLTPTLNSFLAVDDNSALQGKTYFKVFSGKELEDRVLYFHKLFTAWKSQSVKDALLMDQYKLIVKESRAGEKQYELFYLPEDPGELENVADRETRMLKSSALRITKIRKENEKKLEENLAKIGKDVNLIEERKKTLKHLRSLGYIR